MKTTHLLSCIVAFSFYSGVIVSARECGQVIATVSKEQVELAGNFFIQSILTGDLAGLQSLATGIFLGSNTYSFQVIKVCGECRDIVSRFRGEDFLNEFADYGAFRSYCGEDSYGYGARHSGLLFLPIDSEGKPLQGKLRTLLVEHQTETELTGVPTLEFPDDVTAFFTSGQDPFTTLRGYQDYIEGTVAAASGAAVILPDNLGYGESFPSFARTPYLQQSAMQSGVNTFFAADLYVQNSTSCSTRLDNVITLSGASEGGYDVIPIASAFQRLGFRIKQVFSISPVLDSQQIFRFVFETFLRHQAQLVAVGTSDVITDTTQNRLFQLLLPYLSGLLSIETPGYGNTGTGQLFLRDEFLTGEQDVRTWVAPPSPLGSLDIISRTPVPAITMSNVDLFDLFTEAFTAGITDACASELAITKEVNHLCATFAQMSVWEALKSVDFPVSVSFSNEDTVIPTDNFPDELFDNENVSKVQVLFNGLLNVTGDHFESILIGQTNTISYFSVGAAADLLDGANKITNLTTEELAVCLGVPVDVGDDDDNDSSSPYKAVHLGIVVWTVFLAAQFLWETL